VTDTTDLRPADVPHPAHFRDAISRFATGVTVITTNRPDGPAGMTASAVSSLSLDPLMLLVCISNRLPTHDALLESRRFAVNVLGEDDEALARRFATPSPDKFSGLDIDNAAGVPVLSTAIAHFVCDVHERLPGGDHSIFIGRVRHCDFVPHRRPLLYFGSSFGWLRAGKDGALHDACAWEASLRM
jgi:3-hydroxy-9,10-secoandrosta-1,3,5(10)-triene-9,17-dione monooxygenase reductase component